MRVPRSQVRYLRAARVVEDGERPTVIARYEGLEHAFHSLLGWGAHAEVLAPRELRDRIAAAAAETVALYAERGLAAAERGDDAAHDRRDGADRRPRPTPAA